MSGEQPAGLWASQRSCSAQPCKRGRGAGVGPGAAAQRRRGAGAGPRRVARARGVDVVSKARPVVTSSRMEKASSPRRAEPLPSPPGAFPQVFGAVSSHPLVNFCQQRRVTDGGFAASPFLASFEKHFSANLARFLLDMKFRICRFQPTELGIPRMAPGSLRCPTPTCRGASSGL